MYAVIETGGKQYRVEVGTEVEVELLDASAGETVTLDRVLLVADGDEASIGRPLVAGASVSAEVVRQDRAPKVISFKYRPKARRRVKKGHRQDFLLLRITDVVLNGKSAAAALEKAQAEAKTEREITARFRGVGAEIVERRRQRSTRDLPVFALELEQKQAHIRADEVVGAGH